MKMNTLGLTALTFGTAMLANFGWAQHGAHGSQLQREAALSNLTRKIGPFTGVVQTFDPSQTLVGFAVLENGKPMNPGVIPTQIEYVARNVPFTPLPVTVSGTYLVGQIPSTLVDSYTLRVTLKWDGYSYQERFFINRKNTKPGAR